MVSFPLFTAVQIYFLQHVDLGEAFRSPEVAAGDVFSYKIHLITKDFCQGSDGT